MKNLTAGLTIAFIVSILPLATQAATRRVPMQFPTIQAAVNAASNGDTVRVASGTYFENVAIDSKAVSLIADEGPEHTIIDAGYHGRALTITNTGAGLVTISGFSLKNGHVTFDENSIIGPGQGGAIYADGSNIKMIGNNITDNGGCLGMAIRTGEGKVTLQKNRIERNIAVPNCSVAAVYMSPTAGNETEVSENVISDHMAIGLVLQGEGKATVANNIFRNNDGRNPWQMSEVGGLDTWGTELTVRNNLFVSNAGTAYGGAYIGAANDPSATVLVQNNSFSGNHGPIASGVVVSGYTTASHRVTKNQFDDTGSMPSISCMFPIEKDNVFASPLSVALQACTVKQ